MNAHATDITRISDAASCRKWLDGLQAGAPDRLAQLDRLWARLDRPDVPADLVEQMLDQARPIHLSDLEGRFRQHADCAFPMPASAWAVMHESLASLRRARDLYKRVHTRLVDDSGVSTRMVIPGSSMSLRATLPLARALDYQSRVIREQLLRRVQVPEADWNELMLLARHVRASTFMDEVLPDASPLIKAGTSRALFTYPLLLQAAWLHACDDAEIQLVDRMARQWAGKVGFRIDEGLPDKDNRHGPTLPLTASGSVRLDTQALIRRLTGRLQLLAAQTSDTGSLRLPRGLGHERMTSLLETIRLRWTDAYRADPQGQPTSPRMSLRIGPPASQRGSQSLRANAARGATESARQADMPTQSAPPASMSYVYGRYEKDDLLRSVMASVNPPAAALDQLMAGADWVIPAGGTADLMEFHRRGNTPVAHGALVTFIDPDSDGKRLRLGRIVSRRQALDTVGESARLQRLLVRPWPDSGELVGVRLPDSPFFEDAFLICGKADRPDTASVIVPTGRWRAGQAMMRTPGRDLRIEFDASLEREAGFERVSVRILDPLR